MDAKLNPQELTALVQAWQAGAMGQADMLYNLQRGEMLRPDYDINTIQDEIDAENGAASERNQADIDADDDDEQPQLALVGE
jgi:phosphopantothenoylcysteine synthetase/decarboxylase